MGLVLKNHSQIPKSLGTTGHGPMCAGSAVARFSGGAPRGKGPRPGCAEEAGGDRAPCAMCVLGAGKIGHVDELEPDSPPNSFSPSARSNAELADGGLFVTTDGKHQLVQNGSAGFLTSRSKNKVASYRKGLHALQGTSPSHAH